MSRAAQQMTDGRLDASILRKLLIAVDDRHRWRTARLWPSPEHGKDIPRHVPSIRPPDDGEQILCRHVDSDESE